MNSKIDIRNSASDVAKYVLAVLFTCLGIGANYYYHAVAWPLRLAAWIFLAASILFILLQTAQGKKFQVFAKESRMELRKVDWPARRETLQFTMGVVIMVVIMALALWLIDTALLWTVKWFTG